MEKKTNVAKENHNREDQHFSETWYRDGGRIPPKVSPIRIMGDMQKDAREEIYKEYKKLQRKDRLIAVGWAVVSLCSSILAGYLIIKLVILPYL